MVRLEKVNAENIWKILELKVKGDQTSFVATNTQSIAEAYLALAYGGHALPFGIYNDATLVGFLMIGYGVDKEWKNPPAIAINNYSIWRLMIDEKYQRQGFGKQALIQAIDYIKTFPLGKAECIYLSYEKENVVAKKLYESLGFVETGDFDDEEIIAAMQL